MIRQAFASSLLLALGLGLVSVASAGLAGCSKDNQGAADAAADAPAAVAVVDAAVAVVDAAVEAAADLDAGDAATPPLASATVRAIPKPVPKPDPPICSNAREARARNSPAAPGLEARCKAAGGTL